jgi:hypothetical protein
VESKVVSLAKIEVSLRDGLITLRLSSLALLILSRKRLPKGNYLKIILMCFARLAIDLGVPVVSMNQII